MLALLLACTAPDDAPPAVDDSPASDSAGADSATDSPADSAPPPPRLLINEFMASNELSYAVQGDTPDWIELYNPNDEALSLAGWRISDGGDGGALDPGLSVPARSWLLLIADGDPSRGPAHLALSLNADGEEIQLTAPEGWRSDWVRFGPQATDIAAARAVDGDESAGWVFTGGGTPGRSNGG